jgi:hypothetical protein
MKRLLFLFLWSVMASTPVYSQFSGSDFSNLTHQPFPDLHKDAGSDLFADNPFRWIQNFNKKNASLKTTPLVLHKLDSIVVDGSGKKIFDYGYGDMPVNWVSYIFDRKSITWNPSDKFILEYDRHKNLLVLDYYIWNAQDDKWNPQSKENYTYNQKGNLLSRTHSYWVDDSESWRVGGIFLVEYDNNDSITLTANYVWNQDVWIPFFKVEYDFTSTGKKSKSYYGEDNQWVEFRNTEYWFNEKGQYIKRYEIQEDEEGNLSESEATYEYDEKLRLIKGFSWFKQHKNGLTRSYMYQMSYDENDNLLVDDSFEWDEETEEWNHTAEISFDYDIRNNRISQMGKFRFNPADSWRFSYKREWDYDLEVTADNLLMLEYFFDFPFYNMPTAVRNYNYNEGELEPLEPAIFYWSFYFVSSRQIQIANTPDLYPNPFSHALFIKLPETTETAVLEIFDISGRKVLERDVTANTQIHNDGLKKGVYLYRITGSAFHFTGKIVKQ